MAEPLHCGSATEAGLTGVLLSNLGTPDAPTPAATRRYLREFLWDPRIVSLPRGVWWLILHGLVLRLRPRRSAHAYQRIWTAAGSPLLTISRAQATALQALLTPLCPTPVRVSLGMRYGTPSIAAALEELRAAGVQKLVVLPLYPQYSSATTASTFDAVTAVLRGWNALPTLHMISDYHDAPWYIDALAASVRQAQIAQGQPDCLLFSFHGMPQRTRDAGDPYYEQCLETAHLVAEKLRLPQGHWQVSFQSRFGKEQWLQPYTDATLGELARKTPGHVHVICPGFAADCLETLEEIALLNRDLFLAAGGRRFHYIPALNDNAAYLQGLAGLVRRHAGEMAQGG